MVRENLDGGCKFSQFENLAKFSLYHDSVFVKFSKNCQNSYIQLKYKRFWNNSSEYITKTMK